MQCILPILQWNSTIVLHLICTKCLFYSELCEELEIRDTEIKSEDFIPFSWKTGEILLKVKKKHQRLLKCTGDWLTWGLAAVRSLSRKTGCRSISRQHEAEDGENKASQPCCWWAVCRDRDVGISGCGESRCLAGWQPTQMGLGHPGLVLGLN